MADYRVVPGFRIREGQEERFVIRPDGNCGWNPVKDNQIIIHAYDSGKEIKRIDTLPYVYNENTVKTDQPILSQTEINKIIGAPHIDLSDTYLSDLRISGDFSFADFTRTHFLKCKLRDADFVNCNFTEALLRVDSRDSEFIHCNFNKAYIHRSNFYSTVMDVNRFNHASFSKVEFGRYTVLRDNSFLQASMREINMRHVDVRGANRWVETIDFHIYGENTTERERMQKRILDLLQDKKPELMDEMRLTDIDWEKVEKIFQYETEHNVPIEKRITEWFGDFGMAVLKPGTTAIRFYERYEDTVYESDWQKRLEEAVAESVEQAMVIQEPMELEPEVL